MSIANVLFNVLAPVAVLIGLGAALGSRLKIDAGSLSRLAYWVLGPAFIFSLLAGAELESSVVVRLIAVSLAGMMAALVTVFGWARLAGVGYEAGAGAIMTGIWGNVGNTGLAIVAFALGDEALPIAGVLMVTINLVSLVFSVGMARARSESVAVALWQGLSAPMSIAGALALVVNLTGLGVPLLADRSITLLAGALIPIMLFTLGMQLAADGLPRPIDLASGDLVAVAVSKLAIAPLVAAAAGGALGLSGNAFDAAVIQSAMPPAVFCAVVATEYDLAPERVTTIVVATTLLATLTLPIVLLAI